MSAAAIAMTLVLAGPVGDETPTSPAQERGARQVAQAQSRAERGASVDPAGLGLRATADGGYLYEDPGRRFKAAIGVDGTVYFADPWRRPARRRRGKRRERGRCCGTPAGGPLPAMNAFGGVPVSGPTEWIFRARGRDPAAAAKAQFLDRTRSLRTQLAQDWMRQRMREALDALDDDLDRLWADTSLDAATKRAITFARWDSQSEAEAPEGASSVDELRASFGDRARRRIEAFVRRELPKGGATGFSKAELSHLNARRQSSHAFAPYQLPRSPR